MKTEIKRKPWSDGTRRVELWCGGESVTSMRVGALDVIDWKNASEAQYACAKELRKWIAEDEGIVMECDK